MITELKLPHGFSIKIKKGIAVSSGMGGSSASAVAAVVAANGLLKKTLSKEQMLDFALAGEAVASGAIHGDNVGPCLLGGLTLLLPTAPMQMVSIPVPSDIFCVLVHPELKVETRQARSILRPEIRLSEYTHQTAWLTGFISGCFKKDHKLIARCMQDVVIEPQRSQLITGFYELKKYTAIQKAIGFGISGSGPSVFAWVKGKAAAVKLKKGMMAIFKANGLESQGWISPVQSRGARVVS